MPTIFLAPRKRPDQALKREETFFNRSQKFKKDETENNFRRFWRVGSFGNVQAQWQFSRYISALDSGRERKRGREGRSKAV